MTDNLELQMDAYLPLRDVVFQTLRGAILKGDLKPGERLMELQTLPLDKAGNYNFQQGYAANLMTVAEGVINPDLKSKELQEHFGAINASDLAKILFKTEVPEIATEIANLSSPDVVDEEELKN